MGPARRVIDEIAAEDPAFFSASGWTPNALLYRRETPRFLELLPGGESPLLRYYRGWALAKSARTDEARRELLPALRTHPADVFARLAEALATLLDGRDAEARLSLGQLALQRERLGASDGEVTFKLAELLARAGEWEAALTQLEKAVAQGFFCAACLVEDDHLRPLQPRPECVALLGQATARHQAFGRRFHLGGVLEPGGAAPRPLDRSTE